MERLKNKGLKKSFFMITALFLSAGILLSVISFTACIKIRSIFDNSPEIKVTMDNSVRFSTSEMTDSVRKNEAVISVLSILQLILPVCFIVLSLILADVFFYHFKLKKPLEILTQGAERIQHQRLDFTIEKYSDDELGSLCSTFETMRSELLRTSQELWRQAEERKRLNAAFAHDLRNPVTVLKGSAKILSDKLQTGSLSPSEAQLPLSLILQYSGRIESYISSMTSVQKLEELQCVPKPVECSRLKEELAGSLSLLASASPITLDFRFDTNIDHTETDKNIFFNVAENLVSNALRYAKSRTIVNLSCTEKEVRLTVCDDGPGFPASVLNKGAAPFLRGDTSSDDEHFGMGLYVCRLLCMKHGGSLIIENTAEGSKTTAIFSKP